MRIPRDQKTLGAYLLASHNNFQNYKLILLFSYIEFVIYLDI